ncbi:hypothetical protein VCHENC02_3290B, partial [Vibrio harveyi]
SKHCGFCK